MKTLIKFEFRRRLFSPAFVISTLLPIVSILVVIAFHESDGIHPKEESKIISIDSFTVSQTTIDTLNIIIQKVQESYVDDGISPQQRIEDSLHSVNQLITIGFALILYIFLIQYGVQILQCVLEEKTNRMAEILLTVISPIKLLFGKIVAIGLIGLFQIAIWLSTFLIIINIQEFDLETNMNHILNHHGELVWSDLPIISPLNIVFIIIIFVCGYLFYASLFTCLGVSIDGVTDSSQSTILVIAPLLLSIFLATSSINGESNLILEAGTYFPFTSPIVLLVQIGNGLPILKVIISLLILMTSTYFTLKIAVIIYKKGMIHYGSKITLKQMIQWIKK